MADTPEKVQHGDPILRKLDRIRGVVAFLTLGRAYLWVVLMVAVLVFGGVLADHAFVLQRWGRQAFFDAFVSALIAALVAATLVPMLRRVSRIYVARRIEQQRPELRNTLISYLQCRDDPSTPVEIKRLMARRAAGHIRSFGAGVVVDYTGYLRLAAAIAAVGAAFLLYWGFSPKSPVLSMERLFRPQADIRPPTATQLYDVKPGELYVVRGDQPALTASVRGVRPDGVYAVWDGASFAGRRILLEHKDADQWQGAFPPVLEDGGYYLAAGDTRTDRYGIHVIPKPTVDRVRLEITPPAYTGLPARTVENADAEVPSGTQVKVRAYTSVPAAQGYMAFDDGRRTWLDPVQGEQALGGELTVTQSGSYQVHFESVPYPDGSTFSDSAPVTYRLTCLADKPPTVSVVAPDDGVTMQPKDTAQIVYKAADDYGISHVRLLYTATGLTMQTVDVAAPGVRELKDAHYVWDLASTAVLPGQTLTYTIEVEDNHPGRAQTGQSEPRRIIIAGPEGSPDAGKGQPPAGGQPPAAGEQPKTDDGQSAKEAEKQSTQQPPAGAQQPVPGQQPPAGDTASQPGDEQRAANNPSAGSGQANNEQPPSSPGQAPDNNPFQPFADHVRDIYNALGQQPPGQDSASQQQGQAGQPPSPAGPPQQAPDANQQASGQAGAPQAGQQPQGGQAAGQSGGQGSAGQSPQAPSGQTSPHPSSSPGGSQAAGGQSAGGQGGNQPGGSQGAGSSAGQGGQQTGSSGASGPSASGGQSGGAAGSGAGGQSGAAAGGSQPGGGQQGAASSGQGAQGAGAGQSSGASAAGATGASGQPGGAAGSAGGGQSGAAAGGSQPGGDQQGAQGTGADQSSGASAASGPPASGGSSAAGATGASGAAASGVPGGTAGGSGTGVKGLPLAPEPAPHTVPPLKELDAQVENLSQMLDEDRVPERVFKELGMNREQLRQFIEDYRRKRAAMPQGPAEPPAKLGEEPGRLLQGAAAATPGVQVKDARPAIPTSDTLHSRFEGAADHLSSRYRDLVNQYYKALSEEQ